MAMTPRRIAGGALALVAIAVLFAGRGAIRRSHDETVRGLLAQSATQRGNATQAWLAELLKGIESQAKAAAELPRIKDLIEQPGGKELYSTIHDIFQDENWWESYRRDFSLQGVAIESDKLDVANTVKGLDPDGFDVTALVAEARAHRSSSHFLRAGQYQWPYLAGAALIDARRPTPAVLVLAKAFDQALVQQVSSALHATVSLSDGQHELLTAGGAAKGLAGRESQGTVIAPDLTYSSIATPLMPGLWLWTSEPVGTLAVVADASSANTQFIVMLIAGLLCLGGLALALWPAHAQVPANPAALATGTSNPQLAAPTGDTASGTTLPSAIPGALAISSGPTGKTPPSIAKTPPSVRAPMRQTVLRSGNSDPRLAAQNSGSTESGVTDLQEAPIISTNVFGRYVLLDLLGEGGMAEVYTAVTYGAERFRRSFVVKRLRAEMLHNPAVVSSFIDEANLASSLVHSNILPVFDFGKIGDEYYMATEYILGRDLGKVARRAIETENAALPMQLAFFAAHQTLEALDYAHQKKSDDGRPLGIVHRDISPNNILISQRGEVKLFDFGIAKSEGRLTQTAFGMVKGNVRFMSPEQARGDTVDPRSDLFSVGLVIYYVLTGDTFYTADTAYNLLVKAAHGPGPTELANLARLPPEAQTILTRALQTDPAARYQTAAEFAAALHPFVLGNQAALGKAMERLFGRELQEEQSRFAAAAAAVGEAERPMEPVQE